MKNSIQLSIPNPCSEKWENFTPTSTGGFCSSCFKTVIDFTKMSDAEIMKFIKDKPAHTCGRFRNDQLKEYREVPVYSIKPSGMMLKAALISLLLALIAKPSFSQAVAEPAKKEVVSTSTSAKDRFTSVMGDIFVKGTVISTEDGSPLPGVNVILIGSTAGVVTDANGFFEFPEKLKEGDVLQFSFIGLQTQKIVIGGSSSNPLTISMALDVELMGEVIMMGKLNIEEPYTPKKNSNGLVAFIKRLF